MPSTRSSAGPVPAERIGWSNGTKPSTPSATTSGLHAARDARWGPSGLLCVVGDSPTAGPSLNSTYARVLLRQGDVFTDLGALPSIPLGSFDAAGPSQLGIAYGAAWSPDGDHLAVGLAASPFIHVYRRDGAAAFTKLSNPATLPSEQVQQPAYSPWGDHLACAHVNSPFVTIYSRSGDTYTKLSNPGTLPAGNGISCGYSPDGRFLAVAHSTTPFVTIYERSGVSSTYTKLSNPASLPSGQGTCIAFSADSRYLAVAAGASPFVLVYRIDGSTFTKISDPASLPPSNVRELSWAGPQGRHLYCSCDSSPYHVIYRLDTNTLTKLPDLTTAPGGLSYSAVVHPDGRYLAVSGTVSPFLDLYKTGG